MKRLLVTSVIASVLVASAMAQVPLTILPGRTNTAVKGIDVQTRIPAAYVGPLVVSIGQMFSSTNLLVGSELTAIHAIKIKDGSGDYLAIGHIEPINTNAVLMQVKAPTPKQ